MLSLFLAVVAIIVVLMPILITLYAQLCGLDRDTLSRLKDKF